MDGRMLYRIVSDVNSIAQYEDFMDKQSFHTSKGAPGHPPSQGDDRRGREVQTPIKLHST